MTGQTTAVEFSLIRCNSGSDHPSVVSQCASRNMSTSPDALAAPKSLALIRPTLDCDLISFVAILSKSVSKYSCRGDPKKVLLLASSTKIISRSREDGVRFITL